MHMQKTIAISSSQVTISSLEIVDLINESRKRGEPKLRHSDFLAKVPKVLSGGERNFSSTYTDGQNKQRACYTFPKREACLMAMSYSYELQAKVYDRMTDLEQATAANALPPPHVIGVLLDQVSKLTARLDARDKAAASAESAAQKALKMIEPTGEIGQGNRFTLIRAYYRSGKKQLKWALKFHSLQAQAAQLELALLDNEYQQAKLGEGI